MSPQDSADVLSAVKLYIFNIALCAFLLLGVVRLVLEELASLIPLYKKVRRLLKQDFAPPDTMPDLRHVTELGVHSEVSGKSASALISDQPLSGIDQNPRE
jgi:hypothetical protein